MATTKLKTERATHTSHFIPSDAERAVFLGNPILDNLMSGFIALGSEVWATRRRMHVLEALLEEKGVTNDMIEQYVPSPEQEEKWEKDQDRFIDLTYSPLLREGDMPMTAPYQDTNE